MNTSFNFCSRARHLELASAARSHLFLKRSISYRSLHLTLFWTVYLVFWQIPIRSCCWPIERLAPLEIKNGFFLYGYYSNFRAALCTHSQFYGVLFRYLSISQLFWLTCNLSDVPRSAAEGRYPYSSFSMVCSFCDREQPELVFVSRSTRNARPNCKIESTLSALVLASQC